MHDIEVLHGSHVAWQEQWKCFALERTFVPLRKRVYCSCHATWLPCKTFILISSLLSRPQLQHHSRLGILIINVTKLQLQLPSPRNNDNLYPYLIVGNKSQRLRLKGHFRVDIKIGRAFLDMTGLKFTLAPNVFLEPQDSCEVAKTSRESARKRKTSAYLGLKSHFHAEARFRIWPSGSHWLIFLQRRKSIWLVGLIGNTKGTRDC